MMRSAHRLRLALYLLLWFLALALACAKPASAQTVGVNFEPVSGLPGQTVTIAIDLAVPSSIANVAGVSGLFSYNTNDLIYVPNSAALGAGAPSRSSFAVNPSYQASGQFFFEIDSPYGAFATGTDQIITLQFTINPSTTDTSTALTWIGDSSQDQVDDDDANPVNSQFDNGSVTISQQHAQTVALNFEPEAGTPGQTVTVAIDLVIPSSVANVASAGGLFSYNTNDLTYVPNSAALGSGAPPGSSLSADPGYQGNSGQFLFLINSFSETFATGTDQLITLQFTINPSTTDTSAAFTWIGDSDQDEVLDNYAAPVGSQFNNGSMAIGQQGRRTLTVASLADDAGAGELRAAINQANSDAAGDTIVFANGLKGTITLTGDLPQITAPMTIQGPGAKALAIDGAGTYRPFQVYAADSVAISDLTITSGSDTSDGNGGGGILVVDGSLALTNCVLSGDSASALGGGIRVETGASATIEDCVVTVCAAGFGGGIENEGNLSLGSSDVTNNTSDSAGGIGNQGSASIAGCLVAQNSCNLDVASWPFFPGGGGVYNLSGELTVIDTTIIGNKAVMLGIGVLGAGMLAVSGTTTIVNCAITGNLMPATSVLSLEFGGGLATDDGETSVDDCTVSNNTGSIGAGIGIAGGTLVDDTTISGNVATFGGGGVMILDGLTGTFLNSTFAGNIAYQRGGALYVVGQADATNCTFTQNSALLDGGAISTGAAASMEPVALDNCVLYGDAAPTDTEISSGIIGTAANCDIQGGVTSTAVSDDGGNINADPLFDPNGLQNNGGFAPTVALQADSPCFAAGDPTTAPPADERGVARPNPPSIGAYDGAPLPLIPAPTIFPPGGATTNPAGIQVTLSDALEGASIYYTLDGSSPTQASTLYTGPFYITSTSILRALAAAPGYASGSPVELVGGAIGDAASADASGGGVSPDGNPTVSGVQSATFIVEAADLHTYPAGLSMISAPFDYTGQTFASIFDMPNDATIAIWDPASSSYEIAPAASGGTLSPGQGYWVDFAQPTSLRAVGTPTDPSQSPSVALADGWNMIGTPMYPVLLSAITVEPAGSTTSVSLSTAVSRGWIGGALYTLQGSSQGYTSVSSGSETLEPHQAYWIYANAQYHGYTMILPPNGTSVPYQVEAEQGTAITQASSTGVVTLSIPTDALSQNTTITVTTGVLIPSLASTTITPVGEGSVPDAPTTGALAIGTGVELGPTGTQFSTPVTLQLPVNPADVPTNWLVTIATIDGSSNATLVPQSELDDFVLSGGIAHFSTWAAVALNPWWGIYQSGDTFVEIDLGGNVTAANSPNGQLADAGPFVVVGSVDGNGAITSAGSTIGQMTAAANTTNATATGQITLPGTGTQIDLTGTTVPLSDLIDASTAHS